RARLGVHQSVRQVVRTVVGLHQTVPELVQLTVDGLEVGGGGGHVDLLVQLGLHRLGHDADHVPVGVVAADLHLGAGRGAGGTGGEVGGAVRRDGDGHVVAALGQPVGSIRALGG